MWSKRILFWTKYNNATYTLTATCLPVSGFWDWKRQHADWCDVSKVNVTADVLLCFSSGLVKGKGKKKFFLNVFPVYSWGSCYQVFKFLGLFESSRITATHSHAHACRNMHTAHPAIKTNSGGAFWKHSSSSASQCLIITKIFFFLVLYNAPDLVL